MGLLVVASGAIPLAALRNAGAGIAGSSPVDGLPRGQMIAKVLSPAEATQRWALCLRPAYDPARPSRSY